MTDQEFNHDALVGKTNTLLNDCPRSKKISDEALQVVERTNALLDESNRLKKQWYASNTHLKTPLNQPSR